MSAEMQIGVAVASIIFAVASLVLAVRRGRD